MSKFKTGDTVYSIFEGLGTIVEIRKDAFYPIIVSFVRGIDTSYTEEGKSVKDFLNPDLLTVKEARAKGYDVPKQKVQKTAWLNVYNDHFTAHTSKGNADTYADPGRLDCVEITFEHEVKE